MIAAANRYDTFDSFTVTAVDRKGNVYVTWSERCPHMNETIIYYAYSKDRGATWSRAIRVSRIAKVAIFPWIVAGDEGRIDIVYYGTRSYGPTAETMPPGATWNVYMAQSLDAVSKDPTFTEVKASPVLQKGSICTSGTGCDPGTRDLLDFFQVDVDSHGMANIAYTDNYTTPPDPDPSSGDPHQEWITFVQQKSGPGLFIH